MRLLILLLFSFITTFSIGQDQQLFHRAKISLIGNDIAEISKLGIETDHGILIPKRSLESDFSESELALIASKGFEYEIVINDVVAFYQNPNRPSELEIDYSRTGNCDQGASPCEVSEYKTPRYYSGGSMGGYKTYSEMVLALDSMALLYPDLITQRVNIDSDTTHNGHSIFYLKISDNPNEEETEPQILYTALHHAREPNSMSQMLFYMWYVLENYATDPEIKAIVDNNELYFIPCVNPDGYILNEINNPSGGGLWRKNGRSDEDGQLFGVDLNRNYDYFWGYDNQGSSNNPNSETYRGESGFSEPETQAVKTFCEAKNFVIALNYHSYGNLLIHPWGYNDAPTEEDHVFKTIGNEMIEENCFKMGTGSETVGYTTNGDSDDWMYGQDTTKNKIYSYTPEVGPSFWPPKQDILDLNKSCMAMNLAAAQHTSNLYAVELQTSTNIDVNSTKIDFELIKKGLGLGAITVIITPNSPNLQSGVLQQNIDILTGNSTVVSYPISLSPNIENGNEIELTVVVEGNGYVTEEMYTFTYFNGELTPLVTDISDTIDYWNPTRSWNITDQYVYEGKYSLADSPYGNYQRDATSSITLKNSFDLSAATYAELTFAAKWDIENDYDYALVEASKDGINFSPLCGKYTNMGTADQLLFSPLYDDIQREWVNEEISLQDYVGEETVFLRFSIVADGFIESEGIYIDDIKINKIDKKISSTLDDMLENITVYPNPTSDIVTINGLKKTTDLQISMYDIAGRKMVETNETTFDISSFKNGVYTLIIQNKTNQISRKVVKL